MFGISETFHEKAKMMEYGKRNNLKLDTKLPGRCEYVYMDSPDHRADRLFIRSRIPVRFRRKEMGKEGFDYVLVFCRFKRKYESAFLECMADLDRAMMLEGCTGYRGACDWFSQVFPKAE